MSEQPVQPEQPARDLDSPRTKRVYIIRGPRRYYAIRHDKDEAHSDAKILTLLNKGSYFVEVR
jgi:hypothetical protein